MVYRPLGPSRPRICKICSGAILWSAEQHRPRRLRPGRKTYLVDMAGGNKRTDKAEWSEKDWSACRNRHDN